MFIAVNFLLNAYQRVPTHVHHLYSFCTVDRHVPQLSSLMNYCMRACLRTLRSYLYVIITIIKCHVPFIYIIYCIIIVLLDNCDRINEFVMHNKAIYSVKNTEYPWILCNFNINILFLLKNMDDCYGIMYLCYVLFAIIQFNIPCTYI